MIPSQLAVHHGAAAKARKLSHLLCIWVLSMRSNWTTLRKKHNNLFIILNSISTHIHLVARLRPAPSCSIRSGFLEEQKKKNKTKIFIKCNATSVRPVSGLSNVPKGVSYIIPLPFFSSSLPFFLHFYFRRIKWIGHQTNDYRWKYTYV